MIETTLDGKKMSSKEVSHLYIKEQLNIPWYYGNNLDALWDVLSTYDKSIKIYFINAEKLIGNLGDYGKSIISVFQDAEKENHNISFEIVSCNVNLGR